jgi:hypothetical protein
MVEFALLCPLFLIVVLATIDYGGYFSARLSVENAARAGVRFAVTQACGQPQSTPTIQCPGSAWTTSTSPTSTTIEGVIRSAANGTLSHSPVPNADCLWNGSTVPQFGPDGTSSSYFDFKVPSGSIGCMSISYWDISTGTSAALCAYFSAASGWHFQGSYTTDNCVVADDLIQVTVGFQYQTLTPLPAVVSSALTTAATIDLLEER